ncbi:MAG: lactonase family protein [Ruminococcaceae bacterium]|jgi:6-phosphogluconolactonase|nr:lactonase family protein [Oscillospiraceae bacterium]
MLFYVGTQTRLGGPGIVVCKLENNQLACLGSTELDNPTYVILSSDRKKLYAISSASAEGEEGGSLVTFIVQGDSLLKQQQYSTGTAGPCHLCLSPDGRFIYTAQYQSGTVAAFPVDPPGQRIQLIQHQGRGPHPERQQGAHVHHVSFLPGTQRLIAIDLGLDALVCYEQDPQNGLLNQFMSWSCQPGLGPRHLVYASANLIYLLHELGSAVSVVRVDDKTFTHLQTLSTLPPLWQGENTGAAIRIKGSYLFASNRGHDSIAVLRIQPDGCLHFIDCFSCGGSTPRDFYLLPDNRILVANQGGTVSLLNWDEKNETIRPAGNHLDIAGAVCICPVI